MIDNQSRFLQEAEEWAIHKYYKSYLLILLLSVKLAVGSAPHILWSFNYETALVYAGS